MMAAEILLVLASVGMVGCAQILFKLAAQTARTESFTWGTVGSWLSPSMLAALVVSLGGTVLWVWVLRKAPLGIVYPLYALTFILVPLLDWALFGMPLTPRQWGGAAAIVAGVWLMTGAAA